MTRKKKAPRSRVKVPPGDLSARNRTMVSMFPWKVMPISKLPPSAKKALCVQQDPTLHTSTQLIEKFGPTFKIGIAKIPMAALMVQAMNDPNKVDAFDTFDEYHCEYRGDEKVPRHKTQWPIVLSGEDWGDDEGETIMDGWHRFHSYYRSGIKNVTVLWYVDE